MSKSPPPKPNGSDRDPESGSFLRLVAVGVVSRGEAEGQVSHGFNGTHRSGAGVGSRVTLRVNHTGRASEAQRTGGPSVGTVMGGVNRRILTLVVALVPIVAFGLLLSVVTVPFVSLGPGPTFDTLGEVEGKEVVDIEGTDVHPTSGHLNMTTVVAERRPDPRSGAGAVDVGQRAAGAARSGLPAGQVQGRDRQGQHHATSSSSEDSAEYAALGYPEVPAGGHRRRPSPIPGPSAGKLQDGDAIDMVNDKPVANLERVHRAAEGHQARRPAGRRLPPQERRRRAPTTITLGNNPDRDYGFLGVGVLDAPWAPFTIDFNLANIGGPSAGLMFSLAVVDKLTTGDLNGGKFVAGTGTITGDGKVGPIGGITHKMLRRAGGRCDGLPGARRQLRRGQDRPRRRPAADQGGHPRPAPSTR